MADESLSLKMKKERAHKIVAATVAGAAATAAIPIPIAHMFPLIGEQLVMLTSITAAFGYKVSKSVLTGLLYSAISVSLATFLGKAIVGGLLELLPVFGQAAGAALNAATAAALTTAVGEAYIALMVRMSERGEGGDFLKSQSAREEFAEAVKEKFTDLIKKDADSETPAPDDTQTPASEHDDAPPRWNFRFE